MFMLPPSSNMAVDLTPFGRWTLRDRAALRRLALHWAVRLSICALYVIGVLSSNVDNYRIPLVHKALA